MESYAYIKQRIVIVLLSAILISLIRPLGCGAHSYNEELIVIEYERMMKMLLVIFMVLLQNYIVYVNAGELFDWGFP